MSMSPSLVRVAAGLSVLEVFIIVVLFFAEATAFQAVVVTERSDFFAGGCGQRLVLDTAATASAKVADGATRRKHGPYEKSMPNDQLMPVRYSLLRKVSYCTMG